jgi:acyl-coenzyme A synthetase/AMP-(fatty) acid ligase
MVVEASLEAPHACALRNLDLSRWLVVMENSRPICVVDMVRFWAHATPHRPAILEAEMVVTYRALLDAIDSISDRVQNLDLAKAEPVALALARPSFTIAAAFALLQLGYDVASINRSLFPYLRGAGIGNLIYDIQGHVLSGGRNIRFDKSWLLDKANTVKQQRQTPTQTLGDMIFFTSGTTGLPKKVRQSSMALQELLSYPFTCASGIHQKILIMPNLASTFGFNRACEVLNTGKTACFAPSGEAVLSLTEIFGVELIVASPAQALSLAELKKSNPGYDLNSLKAILIGGGKIGPERVAEIRGLLCRECLSQYGSTEAGVVALAPFETISGNPGAVGFLLPWAKLEIVDEDGHVLPSGSEGSIRYRTPQLLQNLAAFGSGEDMPGVKDGWFYPGDTGSLSANGLLTLTGRITDVINRGGVKVSSAKIEEILEELPEIKEAAACGVTGNSGLEELWIAVVGNDLPLDIEKIKHRVREHREINLIPDEVFVLDELPRGALGKIQKYTLKEVMLAKRRGA